MTMGRGFGVALLIGVLVLAGTAPAGAQDLYDCANFADQEQAQAVLDQDRSDPYGLDGGGTPGVACEALPDGPAPAADDARVSTGLADTGGDGGTTDGWWALILGLAAALTVVAIRAGTGSTTVTILSGNRLGRGRRGRAPNGGGG
jgi:hypothetical protein